MTHHARLNSVSLRLVLGLSACMGFLSACGGGQGEEVTFHGSSAALMTTQSSGSNSMYVYSPQQPVEDSEFVPLLPDMGYQVLAGSPQIRIDYADETKLAGLIKATNGKMEVTFLSDEHATVLEGSLIVTEATGQSHAFKPGDSYFIRRGHTVTWDVQDARLILSFFKIQDSTGTPPTEPSGGEQMMFVYSPQTGVDDSEFTPLGPSESLGGRVLTGSPTLSARIDYQNGNRTAGLFKATNGRVEIVFPFSEHATILVGEVTITDESGQSHTFKPGDSYYVRQGQMVRWEVKGKHVIKSFFNIAE